MSRTAKKGRSAGAGPTAGKRAILVGGLDWTGSDIGCWQGICRYAHVAGNWLFCDAGSDWSNLERAMAEDRIRGIIAGVRTPAIAGQLRATGLPVVNVSPVMHDKAGMPYVGVDDRRVGALAAEYFIARRFKHLAVVPAQGDPTFSSDRITGFCETAAGRGLKVYELDSEAQAGRGRTGSGAEAGASSVPLDKLPRPLAIFTLDDFSGRAVCRACARKGLRVPEDVAVVGVGDFDIICDTAFPPLSSIRIPMQQVGYSAARVLDQLIGGRPPSEDAILLPPVDIHTRQSSDITAVEDEVMALALAFIRANSARRISSNDVVKHCKVHRRLLERRFRILMERTILKEIQRVRTERAISLLMDSNEPMGAVARGCGFRNQDHMGKVFRVVVGRHPRDFRRAFQIR
jgi:LacI family transcriptional regulator